MREQFLARRMRNFIKNKSHQIDGGDIDVCDRALLEVRYVCQQFT